ncbi:MAG: DMT family transporter [bacterium]|nr:DMT family transporter [bacterium]
MEKKQKTLLYVLVQVTVAGLLFPVIKHVLNQGVDPLNFSWKINAVSSLLLLIYGFYRERLDIFRLSRKTLINIIIVGSLGSGCAYVIGFIALKHTSAINYAFIVQTPVFFIPLLAYFFLKERLKPHKIFLIFLLLLGAYLVSTSGKNIIPQRGDLLTILRSLLFSIGIIITKVTLSNVSAVTFSLYRGIFGGLFIVLFMFIGGLFFPQISFDFHSNWGWAFAIGILAAVVVLATNKILELASASFLSMMRMATPVIAIVFAIIILNESINRFQIIGGIIIIFSGIVVYKKE